MRKILITIIFFVFISKFSFSQEKTVADQIIAIVGNNIILESDIEAMYMQYEARGLGFQKDPKCQLLEELLFEKLLINQAELDSVEVSDKEVESELNSRMDYFVRQFGEVEKMLEYFGKKSVAEIKEEFRESVKNQIITQKMQRTITEKSKVTPADVRRFYDKQNKDSLPIVDANVEMQQIIIYPVVTNEEKIKIKQRLEEMRERVLKGTPFTTLAVMYSEDPGSAKKGGEMDFMGRGELVPEFSTAAFILQPGEISPVIETQFGFHIIQMIERKGEKVKVRHILLSTKASYFEKNKAKNKIDSIANLIRSGKLSFEDAAEKFSQDEDTKKVGGLLTNPQNGTSKFGSQEIDPNINYLLKNMQIGEITQPFENPDNSGRAAFKIIKLKNKTKAHTANLNEDYEQIQNMALEAKKQETIQKWLQEKAANTYIKIDKNYKNCNFDFKGWVNQ